MRSFVLAVIGLGLSVSWGLPTASAVEGDPTGPTGPTSGKILSDEQIQQLNEHRNESASDKQEWASDVVQDATALESDVGKMLGEATKANEASRVKCLGDALAQIKGLITVVTGARSALVAALSSGQADNVDHQVVKLSVAESKISELRTAASACTGDAVFTGDTQVEITVDEATQRILSDPTITPPTPPFTPQAGTEEPPTASPL